MKSETITNLVNKVIANNNDNVGKIITDLIKQEQDIKNRLIELHQQKQKLIDEYNHNVNKICREIDSIQEYCPHIETKFIGDASGNNDSYIYCLWCDKELG